MVVHSHPVNQPTIHPASVFDIFITFSSGNYAIIPKEKGWELSGRIGGKLMEVVFGSIITTVVVKSNINANFRSFD